MDFPAKILLFGEYGILLNSKALAIPYSRYSGRLGFYDASSDGFSKREIESNHELKALLNYLKINHLKFHNINLKRLEEEVDHGLFFDSSIPSGFGLGSSGALTAALYDRYAIVPHPSNHQEIKEQLAAIEAWFHGLSSGVDPLTSFLQKPVLLEKDPSRITITDLSPFLNTYSLFLIDSRSKGKTGDLVSHFLEQYCQPGFKKLIDNEYISIINQTISAVIAGDFGSFERFMASYSQFQRSNFRKMIPAAMEKYFEHGIETGDFYLKLCGSGGGGYLLAISSNRSKAESYFHSKHLDYKIV